MLDPRLWTNVFLVFEGGDGAGKSSIAKYLLEQLNSSGIPAILLKEPGGTSAGEAIAEIIRAREKHDLHPVSELLLFEASRIEILQKQVWPALADGLTVLLDRFTPSTFVYQGMWKGVDMATIWLVESFWRQLRRSPYCRLPDGVFVYAVDIDTAIKRITQRGVMRGYDTCPVEDIEALHKFYIDWVKLARENPALFGLAPDAGVFLIDGRPSIEDVGWQTILVWEEYRKCVQSVST